jgi:hypothetical protein
MTWRKCRNPVRGAQVPYTSSGSARPQHYPPTRFRALALFGRRPPERVVTSKKAAPNGGPPRK